MTFRKIGCRIHRFFWSILIDLGAILWTLAERQERCCHVFAWLSNEKRNLIPSMGGWASLRTISGPLSIWSINSIGGEYNMWKVGSVQHQYFSSPSSFLKFSPVCWGEMKSWRRLVFCGEKNLVFANNVRTIRTFNLFFHARWWIVSLQNARSRSTSHNRAKNKSQTRTWPHWTRFRHLTHIPDFDTK